MRFVLLLESIQKDLPPRSLGLWASDWFSALQRGCDLLEEPIEMKNLSIRILEDGLSAEVIDPITCRKVTLQAHNRLSFETSQTLYGVRLTPFSSTQPTRRCAVVASDWFTALQKASRGWSEAVGTQNLSIEVAEESTSAEVTDPAAERSYQIWRLSPKERASLEGLPSEWDLHGIIDLPKDPWVSNASQETVEEANERLIVSETPRQIAISSLRLFWTKAWFFVPLFALVAVSSFSLLDFLHFPQAVSGTMGAILGFQAVLFVWSALAIPLGLSRYLAGARWRHETIRHRSLVLLATSLLLLAGYFGVLWHWPAHLWTHTGVLFVFWSLLILGVTGLLVSFFLAAEVYGESEPGRLRRWMTRSFTAATLAISLIFFFLVDFLGGMYWWHAAYVTPSLRKQVEERTEELRAIQLKTLLDSKHRTIGLFARTEGDWAPFYNNPDLLSWRVSKAIMLSEGEVKHPAWWWRYLPDGPKLASEPFSLEAFLRMPYYFLKQRRKVGGSTPALQAAKNYLDFGQKRLGKGFLRTLGIKLFEEIPRSYIMAQAFTPQETMANYMATLWSGQGANYGLHRMILFFFDVKNPADLDWNQAVTLAASLPNPGRMNPWFLRSCLQGSCKFSRDAAVFEVWKERIRQLKAKLHDQGISVPATLPPFKNGLHRLQAISSRWHLHDAHLRGWIDHDLQTSLEAAALKKAWPLTSVASLSYDRSLTLGPAAFSQPPKPPTSQPSKPLPAASRPSKPLEDAPPRGTVDVANDFLREWRKEIEDIQIAFTLYDSRDGQIASQYGGDLHVDMALARRPVVGSTFKIVTMLVGGYWPDAVPLVNQGKPKKRKKIFVYRPLQGSQGQAVHNSALMPAYVSKLAAFRMSANIALVFLSLRWTWFLPEEKWPAILRIGLAQMLRDKKLPAEEIEKTLERWLKEPDQMRLALIRDFGHRLPLRSFRKQALFEAAKAATAQSLASSSAASKSEIARFLDADSVHGFSRFLQGRFFSKQSTLAHRFQGPVTLEQISWDRDLRMEIGLRYLIHLAHLVAGYDIQRDHLEPVLTLTLGVHNSTTPSLAALAGLVSAQKIVQPRILRSLRRGGSLLFQRGAFSASALPLPPSSLPFLKTAMEAALRAGTASRSGSFLSRRYGASILRESGAKTGTVQHSAGVSCVGYLQHRAGAVTISTPHNRRLVAYHLRDEIRRPFEAAQAHLLSLKEAQKKASSPAEQARLQARLSRTTQAFERHKARVTSYKEAAERFLSMGQTWRKTQANTEREILRAEIFLRRSRQERRQAEVYERYAQGDHRMIRLYQTWFSRFDLQMKENLEKTQAVAASLAAAAEESRERLHTLENETLAAKERLASARQALREIQAIARSKTPQSPASTRPSLASKPPLASASKPPSVSNPSDVPAPSNPPVSPKPTQAEIQKARRDILHTIRDTSKARFQEARARYQAKITESRAKTAELRVKRALRLSADKTPSYHQNVLRLAKNQERHRLWLDKMALRLRQAEAFLKQRTEALEEAQRWASLAKRQEAEYERIDALVHRTHRRWTLRSSSACLVLFHLLSTWKDLDPKEVFKK